MRGAYSRHLELGRTAWAAKLSCCPAKCVGHSSPSLPKMAFDRIRFPGCAGAGCRFLGGIPRPSCILLPRANSWMFLLRTVWRDRYRFNGCESWGRAGLGSWSRRFSARLFHTPVLAERWPGPAFDPGACWPALIVARWMIRWGRPGYLYLVPSRRREYFYRRIGCRRYAGRPEGWRPPVPRRPE